MNPSQPKQGFPQRLGLQVANFELNSFLLDILWYNIIILFSTPKLISVFQTGPKVLHGISFHVKSGERIGIGNSASYIAPYDGELTWTCFSVGRTGSGKVHTSLSLLYVIKDIYMIVYRVHSHFHCCVVFSRKEMFIMMEFRQTKSILMR